MKEETTIKKNMERKMIQRGGPQRSSLERQRPLGRLAFKEYNYKEDNVHYIPTLHWTGETRRKIHKESPCRGGMHTGQYKMIMAVQTVQQLHQTMHQKKGTLPN